MYSLYLKTITNTVGTLMNLTSKDAAYHFKVSLKGNVFQW